MDFVNPLPQCISALQWEHLVKHIIDRSYELPKPTSIASFGQFMRARIEFQGIRYDALGYHCSNEAWITLTPTTPTVEAANAATA